MANTANFAFPYPTDKDSPDVPRDIKALAEMVDDAIRASVPAGSVLATARSTAPDGFLLCDGAAVSRTAYADLFGAIGTTYGTGNGSTTFNVPNLVERVPVGKGGALALGVSGGEKTHTLTEGEMPSHGHTFSGTTGVDSPDHIHEQQVLADGGGGVGLRKDYDSDGTGTIFQQGVGTAGASTRHTHAFSGATAAKGGGAAHNNMQPYQVVNYLIKT